MNDKMIEVRNPDEERRLSQRRASDRDLEVRVAKLEGLASDYRLSITRSEQQRERRTYELLQAAATLMSAVDPRSACLMMTQDEAVGAAERLLAQIERREMERTEHQRKESNHAGRTDTPQRGDRHDG